MPVKKKPSTDQQLLAELKRMHKTVDSLPDEYGHILVRPRRLWFAFLRGIVYGLGIIVAAAIVVPIIIYTLRQTIEWTPLFDDVLEMTVERLEEVQRR